MVVGYMVVAVAADAVAAVVVAVVAAVPPFVVAAAEKLVRWEGSRVCGAQKKVQYCSLILRFYDITLNSK